jgi:integrase
VSHRPVIKLAAAWWDWAMQTLGHSQISLTMNTYSHVLPVLQREAADRMELVLTGRQ